MKRRQDSLQTMQLLLPKVQGSIIAHTQKSALPETDGSPVLSANKRSSLRDTTKYNKSFPPPFLPRQYSSV